MASRGDGQGRQQVYLDLVSALVDARQDAATARFDEELDAALAKGSITSTTAQRLRFWQRASVRALADHTKTVVPAALGALDASQREEAAALADMAETLGPDPQAEPTPAAVAELRPEPGDETAGPAHDTPGAGSPPGAPEASSLEQRRYRLIVADLVKASHSAADTSASRTTATDRPR